MTGHAQIPEEELHAFLDGELAADRAAAVAGALETDPVLAARLAAFASDKAALKAAYLPAASAPLPPAWIARIEQAAAIPARKPMLRRAGWIPAAWALAACVVLVFGATALLRFTARQADPILADAMSAREESLPALTRVQGAALADAAARDALLVHAVGLKLRAPDLKRLGWRLAELDTYASGAALRYAAVADRRTLTLFVRRSAGTPRFDILKDGAVRICIWQDEVVGAVMMGDMTAGQMMRVASAAYVDLNL